MTTARGHLTGVLGRQTPGPVSADTRHLRIPQQSGLRDHHRDLRLDLDTIAAPALEQPGRAEVRRTLIQCAPVSGRTGTRLLHRYTADGSGTGLRLEQGGLRRGISPIEASAPGVLMRHWGFCGPGDGSQPLVDGRGDRGGQQRLKKGGPVGEMCDLYTTPLPRGGHGTLVLLRSQPREAADQPRPELPRAHPCRRGRGIAVEDLQGVGVTHVRTDTGDGPQGDAVEAAAAEPRPALRQVLPDLPCRTEQVTDGVFRKLSRAGDLVDGVGAGG